MSASGALSQGKRIGPYQLLGLLGTGGDAEAWRAVNLENGMPVVLKCLLPEVAKEKAAYTRLEKEFLLPGILGPLEAVFRALDFCQNSSIGPYVVWEYLPGETLRKRLAQDSDPFSLEEIGQIGLKLCRALFSLHERGVVHGDLKSSHVFLARTSLGDVVKLLDFGIAYVPGLSFEEGLGRGTVRTMAPEKANATSIDVSCDIYGVGVILYEIATNRLPRFVDEDSSEMLASQKLSVLRPDLPDALEVVMLRCLAQKPPSRYATCELLAKDLAKATGVSLSLVSWKEKVIQDAPLAFSVQAKQRERVKWKAWGGVLLGLLVLVFTGYAIQSMLSPPTPLSTETPPPSEEAKELTQSPLLSQSLPANSKLPAKKEKPPEKRSKENLVSTSLATSLPSKTSNPDPNSATEISPEEKIRKTMEEGVGPTAIPLEEMPPDFWKSSRSP